MCVVEGDGNVRLGAAVDFAAWTVRGCVRGGKAGCGGRVRWGADWLAGVGRPPAAGAWLADCRVRCLQERAAVLCSGLQYHTYILYILRSVSLFLQHHHLIRAKIITSTTIYYRPCLRVLRAAICEIRNPSRIRHRARAHAASTPPKLGSAKRVLSALWGLERGASTHLRSRNCDSLSTSSRRRGYHTSIAH